MRKGSLPREQKNIVVENETAEKMLTFPTTEQRARKYQEKILIRNNIPCIVLGLL